MNNKLYLITTEGCEGCRIMNNLIKELDDDYSNKLNVTVCNFDDVPEFIKINVKLTDFPTLVFVKDDVIKYHCVGTKPKYKIKDIIKDIDFV